MSAESAGAQNYTLTLEFPCSSDVEADLLRNVLRVDKEPKRSSVQKTLHVSNNILNIKLCTSNVKNLKPSFNSLLDNILLSKELIEEFGVQAPS